MANNQGYRIVYCPELEFLLTTQWQQSYHYIIGPLVGALRDELVEDGDTQEKINLGCAPALPSFYGNSPSSSNT